LLPVPDLLVELPTKSNGGISEDGTSVVYRMTDDAVWHDGRPLDAYDVVFTWELLASGKLLDEPGVDTSVVRSFEAVDARTIRMELSRPDAPLIWRLLPYVLPRHALGDAVDPTRADYWFSPIGSGPYRVGEGSPARYVELLPADGLTEAPVIDVRFAPLAADARTEYDSADAAVWFDGPQPVSEVEQEVSTQGVRWRCFLMNVRDGRPTADPAVRSVVAAVLGAADPAASDLDGPYSMTRAQPHLEDTATVTDELEQAGWLPGADGVRERQGQRLSIRITTPQIMPEEIDFLDAAFERLRSVGFEAGHWYLEDFDRGGYYDRNEVVRGDFDVARVRVAFGQPFTWGWPFEPGRAASWDDPYGLNIADVRSDSVLDAITDVRGAGSPQEAQELMPALGEALASEDIVVWEHPDSVRLLVKGVSGVAAHPLESEVLASAPEWRITVGVSP
jgi:hypothetical protein